MDPRGIDALMLEVIHEGELRHGVMSAVPEVIDGQPAVSFVIVYHHGEYKSHNSVEG